MIPTKPASGVGEQGLSSEKIDALIKLRIKARQQKDFTESDCMRDLLSEQGIALQDNAEGTSWRRT